jgi:signal transduction histidine kinase
VTQPIQPKELLARIHTHLTLRNLQKSLQRGIVERERLIAELDSFAHTVAHDLKNPLSAIIGYGGILEARQREVSDQEMQRYVHNIVQSGYRMSSIIDELLLLSSVREKENIEIEPLDMAEIVSEVQERLAYTIEQYQAEILLPGSWPVALGHAPWIQEIWANYVSNALKYGGTPPRVELGARAPAKDAGVERICFYVRDNGEGLTPEECGRLFVPFERLEQVRAKGHGLGLSIVARIAAKLGGEVGVESEVGAGSTFWFVLPAHS